MKKSTLTMPDINASCMPVVPTARIQALIEKKNAVLAKASHESEKLQAEIERLVHIEQAKVFAEYNRQVRRAGSELLGPITDDDIAFMAEEANARHVRAEALLVAAYQDTQKMNREADHG